MKKLLACLLILCSFVLALQSQSFNLETYATGFNGPVDITNADDDRLFVVEQGGRIKIIDGNGTTLSTPFLNVASLSSSGGERGLLGLAFHPDFAENGYFFVNYTDNSGDTRVVRYSVSPDDPNVADPGSAVNIITINQTQSNHNGGCIKFGPDGYLYIGMGDGGGAGDVPNNAQNPNLLLGKMLRIDIDNGLPYTIPADNPFVEDASVRDEIWAIGLRNPWRFSFDRVLGNLWIGDVGQNAFEEIDFQPADSPGGENYGWRCYEADAPYNLNNCGDSSEYTFPVYTIVQTSGGPCSITGGFVYRGADYPGLVGKYICADFCSGDFFFVEPDGSGGFTGIELGEFPYSISAFGEDAEGELYCLNYGGQVLRVTFDACAGFGTQAVVERGACAGQTNGSVTINISGGTPPYTFAPDLNLDQLGAGTYTLEITDANACSTETSFTINELSLPEATVSVDGNTLSAIGSFFGYQWLLNGTEIPGATSSTYVATEDGSYAVFVTASNGCTNTSNAVDVMVSTLGNIPALEALQITPNPFQDVINLTLRVEQPTDFQLAILTLDGQLLQQRTLTATGLTSERIDLKELPAGTYYFRLSTKEGVVVRRVVKG